MSQIRHIAYDNESRSSWFVNAPASSSFLPDNISGVFSKPVAQITLSRTYHRIWSNVPAIHLLWGHVLHAYLCAARLCSAGLANITFRRAHAFEAPALPLAVTRPPPSHFSTKPNLYIQFATCIVHQVGL